MTTLAYESGLQLRKRLVTGDLSAVELLDYFLARVARYNPELNAIIELQEDEARAQAIACDKAQASQSAQSLPPFHGVPMTIKESFDVRGMHTTRGNPAFKDHIASTDALAVSRLRKAGANIFGKTNVPLDLADFQSYNAIYGTTNNPWDTERTPGGSSGGSAVAMAAGLSGIENGSDIGGSIRNPAHYCGVFGHKPTWGLLPPRGHAAPGVLAQSDLAVIGPIARSAADLEALLLAEAGPDEIMAGGYRLDLSQPTFSHLKELRVAAMVNNPLAPVSQICEARVEGVIDLIRHAGGQVNYDARPDFDLGEGHEVYQNLLWAVMASRSDDATYAQLAAEVAALAPDDRSARAQNLRARFATYRDYSTANEARTHQRWAWHRFFQEYDVMVTPIMATPAFQHDHQPFGQRTVDVDGAPRPYFEQLFWAGLAINSYLPASIVPTGTLGGGLPIGVQIIGPEFGDLKVLRVAKLLELEGLAFVPPPGYDD
jgi:amidase